MRFIASGTNEILLLHLIKIKAISHWLVANSEITERWQSGRMRQSRKLLYSQGYRGFESLSLRKHIFNKARDG